MANSGGRERKSCYSYSRISSRFPHLILSRLGGGGGGRRIRWSVRIFSSFSLSPWSFMAPSQGDTAAWGCQGSMPLLLSIHPISQDRAVPPILSSKGHRRDPPECTLRGKQNLDRSATWTFAWVHFEIFSGQNEFKPRRNRAFCVLCTCLLPVLFHVKCAKAELTLMQSRQESCSLLFCLSIINAERYFLTGYKALVPQTF